MAVNPQARSRKDFLVIALVSAFILLAAWLSSASRESVKAFGIGIPTLCSFKLLTTFDCPGCGLTRSLILAIHGKWAQSYQMHIWGIPLLFILLFQIPYRFLQAARPHVSFPALPHAMKRWISPAIFLSILVPWASKTVATVIVRYL